jgi:hypothetical protein
MRSLAAITLILGALSALPAAEPARPLAPTPITWNKPDAVLGEVARQFSDVSGVPIRVPPNFLKTKCPLPPLKGAPFWGALQSAADKTGTRIALSDGGRKVELVPRGASREVAATSGAFRVVADQVIGRALLDQGVTYHEVHMLVHWEPRVRVYRIDSAPKVTTATDAAGSKVTAESGGTQVLPLDATSEMRVRLSGLTRDSGRITALAGSFTVTAADKLLAFAFDSSGKLPADQKQGDVTAVLRRVQKKDDTWEIEVEVTYPPKQPAFESFQGEWWLRDNRLVVRSPGGKSFVIGDYEVPAPDSPRPLRAIYRFKEDAGAGLTNPTAKGWSVVYETPSPLVETTVPFELKGIPLP